MMDSRLYKWSFGILAMAFCLNVSSMLVDDANADEAKFRYNKPDVERWVTYCKKRHPDKTLKRCCSRRNGACKTRCGKSKYPNTAYDSKAQCVSDCRNTQQQCVGKGSPPDKPKVTSLSGKAVAKFQQCKSVRDVTKHNTCCADQQIQCQEVCDTTKNFQVGAKCQRKCREQLPLCYKKHTKKVYDNLKRKAPNFKWMKTYCSKKKNRRGAAVSDCCIQMHDRCYYSCMGYPDTKEAIAACTERCSKSLDICQGN